MNFKKLALATFIGIMICLYVFGDGQQYLNIELYQNLFKQSPWLTGGSLFVVFVLAISLSLPVTAITMVCSGMVFGLPVGFPVSLMALTLGGTVSLLTGRFLFRDVVERRFIGYIDIVNRGVEKEGVFYLFSVRLIPIFPYWLINLTLGITAVRIPLFMLTTFFGMAPITLIICYAGSQLGNIEEFSAATVFTPGLILAMCLLAVFPFLAKALLKLVQKLLSITPAK